MVLYEFDMDKYKKMQEDTIEELRNEVQQQRDALRQKDDTLLQMQAEIENLKKLIQAQ